MRYGKTPTRLQSTCDADGEVFDVNHALNCPRGGLVYGRHNEMRDLNCNLLELAGLKQVTREPIVRNSDMNGENGLRADWGARGFWDAQQMALFDVCIFNPESSSMVNLTLETLFHQKAKEKSTTYLNEQSKGGRLLILLLPPVMLYWTVMQNHTSNVWQFISLKNGIQAYHE